MKHRMNHSLSIVSVFFIIFPFIGCDDDGTKPTPDRNFWTEANTGLTNTSVTALAINSNVHIFAGTFDGVFRSSESTN